MSYLALLEKVDDHAIADDGDDAEEKVNTTKEVVPHGVDWGMVVPVLVNIRLDLGSHEVNNANTFGIPVGDAAAP